MAPCKFKTLWLTEKDLNGEVIGTWAKACENDNQSLYCCVCEKKVAVVRGKCAINQHAQGITHKEQIRIKNDSSQLKLNSHNSTAAVLNPQKQAVRAELLWTLRIVAKNQSFESVTGLKELLVQIMSECKAEWVQYFTLCPKKLTYYINYALAPHFSQMLIEDVKGYYTLLYDETTNKANQKELQLKILYWSSTKNEIVTRHLQTYFIQHATAKDLSDKIIQSININKLQVNKLLSLGSDGPNVNKKVFRLINDEVITSRKNSAKVGLVDIGTCNIHIIHNAFLKGLEECGNDVSDLIFSIRHFFKDKPARLADYEYCQIKMNVPRNFFIKHVSSRWLTIEPAACRLLEQWPAVQEYFCKYIPTKASHIEKTNTYKSIKKHLSKKTIKAEIMFVISSAKLFTKFTKMFQKNCPLVHILFEEIKELLLNIMVRFCKIEIIESVKHDELLNDMFNINHLISIENPQQILGMDIIDELNRSNVQGNEKLIFTDHARKHYKAACLHIIKKIPIFDDNNILKRIKCLNPKYVKTSYSSDIIYTLRSLPFFIESRVVEDEWKLLQLEDSIWLNNENKRVDHFWNEVFNLEVNNIIKYPNLKQIVPTLLSLSHGNAEVERGFSRSAKILCSDRSSMHENTLNSVLTVSDAVSNLYSGKIENIEITPDLYRLARSARASYEDFLEKCKREKKLADEAKAIKAKQDEESRKELELKQKEKQCLGSLEDELKTVRKKEADKRKAAAQLLEEADTKLTKALKHGNIVEVNVAQGLIQAAANIREEETSLKTEGDKLEKRINKRKSDLLDYFSKKSKIVK